MPRRRSARSCRGRSPPGARPAGAKDRRRGRPARHASSCTSAGPTATTAQSTVYVADVVRRRQLRRVDRKAGRCPSHGPTRASSVSGHDLRHRRLDADGAPTTTVYSLAPDPVRPASSASGTALEAARPSRGRAGRPAWRRRTGILVIGGDGPDGRTTTYKARLDDEVRCRRRRKPALAGPRPDATAAVVGDFVWLWGGHDDDGPVGDGPARRLRTRGGRGSRENPTRARSSGGASTAARTCRRRGTTPRATPQTARSTCVGGADATARSPRLYWAIPTSDGDIPEWKHLEQSDLPVRAERAGRHRQRAERVHRRRRDRPTAPRRDEPPGEHRATGARSSSSAWSGATVPGLKIDGEIGQQLGYLNAAGAGTVNFVILLLIGWAFAHKEQARGILVRVPPAASAAAERIRSSRAGSPSPGSRASPGRADRPLPGVHAAGDVDDVAPTGPAGGTPVDGRGAAALWQTTHQRPVGRQLADPCRERRRRHEGRARRPDLDELVDLADVEEERPSGSSRRRRSASATSMVGIGAAGSSAASSRWRWGRPRRSSASRPRRRRVEQPVEVDLDAGRRVHREARREAVASALEVAGDAPVDCRVPAWTSPRPA